MCLTQRCAHLRLLPDLVLMLLRVESELGTTHGLLLVGHEVGTHEVILRTVDCCSCVLKLMMVINITIRNGTSCTRVSGPGLYLTWWLF